MDTNPIVEHLVVPKATVEIDSNGSAGKVKVKVRATGDTVEEAGAAARREFVTQMAALEAAVDQSWQELLDKIEAAA